MPALVLRQVIIAQDPVCGPIEIIELTALERPHEGCQPDKAQKQGSGNEVDQNAHVRPPARRARSALSVTMIEDPDMASAAISGVTKPATAIGTAIML